MENKKEPMGVSQWLEYGKKYAYDKYWIDDIQNKVVPEKDFDGASFNACLEEINSNFAKLK